MTAPRPRRRSRTRGPLRREARALALGGTLLAALATGAAAQERARNGFWADAGGGFARLRLRCTNCTGVGTAPGVTVTASVGLSVSERVLLGLEGQIWRSTESGPREEVRSLTVVGQWYPLAGRHLFVRGGTGIVQGPVVPAVAATQPASVKGTGVGLSFGVGYDVRLSRRLGLAVQVASHVAALGDLDLRSTTLDDTIAYVTRISLAVVFR